jgi:DNA-binding FadR family transcriptional regulator
MEVSARKVGVKSVSRNTLSKQVVDRIVQLLVSCQIKPGDKLPPEMD